MKDIEHSRATNPSVIAQQPADRAEIEKPHTMGLCKFTSVQYKKIRAALS
jgi:hypothetical protein